MLNAVIIYPRLFDGRGRSLTVGGIQTYLLQLGAFLESSGSEVTILQSAQEAFSRSINRISVRGVPSADPADFDRMVRAEYNLDSTLIVFGTENFSFTHDYPHSLCIQHGVYWDAPRVPEAGCLQLLSRLREMYRRTQVVARVRRHKRLVCVDLNFVNWLRSSGLAKHFSLHYVPNTSFIEITQDELEAKLRRERDRCRPRILFPRRFERLRGTRILAELLAILESNGIRPELVMAGEGTDELYLRSLLEGSPNVTITCKRTAEGTKDLYTWADIVLIPSIGSEGTSIACLEAMANGCLAVVANVGGLSNLVLDRYNGLLSFPDPAEMAASLTEACAEPQLFSRLVRNAHRCYMEAFHSSLWNLRWRRVLETGGWLPREEQHPLMISGEQSVACF